MAIDELNNQNRTPTFASQTPCAATNYLLSLPAKGGDMKANGTRWGWQYENKFAISWPEGLSGWIFYSITIFKP